MDVCDFGGVKAEDNAAILKLRSFKCVAKVFRFVEFCFVLFLLLWIFTSLPFAVRISGEYFRQIVGVVLSPVFIFILCNFIVLTLLFNTGHLSGDNSSTFRNDSLLENVEFSTDFNAEKEDREIIVYEDKQMMFEENTVKNQEFFGNNALMKPQLVPMRTQSEKLNKENVEEISVNPRRSETETVTNSALMKSEAPRRTQSEKLNKENVEEISVKFRQSETEKCRPEVTNSGDNLSETAEKVDELSNEEFQKAIENFIAKQIKFHQQEKLAIVLHSQA
ncbi:hypothetical protein K7X08_032872 [Anisodus acutangulus]|uniref:Uncharacterized protein n=1 Tax=Anisodus acutangulus TaxID=402998 RepID=A0A9Q1R9L5_9SOLA|nr:hypothetical protein K7X08_032872 [Anisodus acutangulus]